MNARVLAAALLAAFLAAGASAATPRRGGTVVYALPGPPITCLNPIACDLGGPGGPLAQVLEGAYEPGPDGPLRPYLVSGATIARNPFTLTYRIRPKARWSDGVPVSASDFEFTYRTFAARGNPGARALYGRIRRFRTLDAKRFVIELREPYADWLSFFDVVLPRHALGGVDLTTVWRERVDNPKTGKAIGNGPFLISRIESGRLIFVRNRAYWGRHTAYLDRFIFRFNAYDPADPLGPLRRNEVDVAELLGPLFASAPEVRRLPGWGVASWPGLADEHLVFRVKPGGHPALRNKLVRRALAYGIDRVEIARRVNAELGRRALPLDSTAFFTGEASYRPNWSVYRYDPARARRLLDQAGCRRGDDGIYSCGSERLQLRFYTNAGSPRRALTLQLIEAQLERAGVDVRPLFVPRPTFFGTLLPGGDFDAALFSWESLGGGSVTAEAKCGDVQNWAGYCNRLTMRDVQQAGRIVGRSQRAALLNAIDLKLARDVPVLPLFQPVVHFAVKKAIRGFAPGGAGVVAIEHNEDWWLAP